MGSRRSSRPTRAPAPGVPGTPDGPRGIRRGIAGPFVFLLLLVSLTSACASPGPLWEPRADELALAAPDSFLVEFTTSEGPFEAMFHRAWSPEGVDRAWYLLRHDYWAGARIYRVVPDFVAQFGFSGLPHLDSIWDDRRLPDEPVVESNTRGTISFARSGPETRSFTLFVNLSDNPRLDTIVASGITGYPPIGRIREGVGVIDGFYQAYDDPAPRQDSIRAFGNEYLRRHFPQLDSIVGTRVLGRWP